MSEIYKFFTGSGLDAAGRLFEDYVNFVDWELEELHDYIQWAFPTWQASQFNPEAPLLTGEVIKEMKESPKALANYRLFLERMICWYEHTDHWLAEFDHNHLRITRIIESVAAILSPEDAIGFYAAVMKRNVDAGSPINDKSIDFWQKALTIGGAAIPDIK